MQKGAATRTWRWTLVGTNSDASPWRTAQTGEAHYLSAGAGVSRGLHAQVGYRDIYPGIDVRYRGTDGRVEQDFLVAPGASPDRIRFRVDDARRDVVDDRRHRHRRGGRRLTCGSRRRRRGR